jgi:ABC-type transporter Mla MlaB component
MTRATNLAAARALRDEIQHALDRAYSGGIIQLDLRKIEDNDSAGLAIVRAGEYLELHIYANLEER